MCFQKVQRLDPDNTAVITDLAKLKIAALKYKEARTKMSARMVSQIFKENRPRKAANSARVSPPCDGNSCGMGDRDAVVEAFTVVRDVGNDAHGRPNETQTATNFNIKWVFLASAALVVVSAVSIARLIIKAA